TDTVTFLFDGTLSRTVTVDANGQATFDPAALLGHALGAGNHTLVVTFSGDADFNPSTSAPFIQAVLRANSTVSLASLPANPVYGQDVSVIATVSAVAPGAGIPAGSVLFTVDGVPQSSAAPLDSAGQATVVLSAPSLGVHHIQASYGGDTNFNTSATPSDFLV